MCWCGSKGERTYHFFFLCLGFSALFLVYDSLGSCFYSFVFFNAESDIPCFFLQRPRWLYDLGPARVLFCGGNQEKARRVGGVSMVFFCRLGFLGSFAAFDLTTSRSFRWKVHVLAFFFQVLCNNDWLVF